MTLPKTLALSMIGCIFAGFLTLTGCYFSDNPLSSTAATDDRLVGSWEPQPVDGEKPFDHMTITPEGTLYRIETFKSDNQSYPETYRARLTRDADLNVLNVNISDKQNDPHYQFFPYVFEEEEGTDILQLFEFSDDAFSTRVSDGSLKGKIEPDKSVNITDTPEAIKNVVANTTEAPMRKPYLTLIRQEK